MWPQSTQDLPRGQHLEATPIDPETPGYQGFSVLLGQLKWPQTNGNQNKQPWGLGTATSSRPALSSQASAPPIDRHVSEEREQIAAASAASGLTATYALRKPWLPLEHSPGSDVQHLHPDVMEPVHRDLRRRAIEIASAFRALALSLPRSRLPLRRPPRSVRPKGSFKRHEDCAELVARARSPWLVTARKLVLHRWRPPGAIEPPPTCSPSGCRSTKKPPGCCAAISSLESTWPASVVTPAARGQHGPTPGPGDSAGVAAREGRRALS